MPKKNLEVASASKLVKYVCGCIVEYPLRGEFSGKGWHALACPDHTTLVGTVEQPGPLELQAEKDFKRILAEPRHP